MITRKQINDILKIIAQARDCEKFYTGYRKKGNNNIRKKNLVFIKTFCPKNVLLGVITNEGKYVNDPECAREGRIKIISLPRNWYNHQLFLSVCFHELIHAVESSTHFNEGLAEKQYVENEIVAEVGALILCLQNDIDDNAVIFNSLQYTAGAFDILKIKTIKARLKILYKLTPRIIRAINKLENNRRII